MSGRKQNLRPLAEKALAAVASPHYNHIRLFLDGLKNPVDEANRLIVTCEKPSERVGEKHA